MVLVMRKFPRGGVPALERGASLPCLLCTCCDLKDSNLLAWCGGDLGRDADLSSRSAFVNALKFIGFGISSSELSSFPIDILCNMGASARNPSP